VSSPRVERGAVGALLDSAFGFFIWAVHLLAIYSTAAVACVLGMGVAGEGARSGLATVLVLLTLAATAAVVLHAVYRYRQQRGVEEWRLRMTVTLGSDAIATVAIAWQLIAILLVPLCV
jgi:hypothetical protein